MGLIKQAVHEFEELYNVDYTNEPQLATSHLYGLCLRCGEIKDTTRSGLCHDCWMWAVGDNSSS